MKIYYIEINGEETQHQIPGLDALHDRILELQRDEDIIEFDQIIEQRFGLGAIVRGTTS